MRKFVICFGFLTLWMISPEAPLAFEQTPAAPVPGTTLVEPGQGTARLAPGNNLEPQDKTPKEKGLSLPGLGSFNILPKFNFGLDLLYGAPSEPSGPDVQPDDDLAIRGSVKKRF